MILGQRIATIRKEKRLSQSALGKLVGTSGDVIGRYERGDMAPSIDVVIKIASALEVSLDYLVGQTALEIDQRALHRLEDISSLPEDEKNIVLKVVDSLLRDFKTRQAYAS
jgi:transcriptional regulator with XRE-family HTH domain